MRWFFIISLAMAVIGSTSLAQAHHTPWSWTQSKAGKMVERDATLRLPPAQRAPVEGELKDAVRLYWALQFAAEQVGDRNATSTFQSLLIRYRRALDQVRDGLAIDIAACKGSGAAVQGKRFKHFRCAVTSELVEIPSTELEYGDRELPIVIESAPRVIGPFQASLGVHVTGKSSMTYR